MKKANFARIRSAAFGAAILVVTATAAQAQATRTWVSGVGNDADPCSRTAPCKTFAGAISKTAAGGYIDALDPGGYGSVTITKSITIDGGAGVAGLLATGGGNDIVVNGVGIVVHLRNLSIESVGSGGINRGLNGISVSEAAEVHVEHCVINGFTGAGITFHPTNGQLFVSDTLINNSTQNGIVVSTGRATIDTVHMDSNGTGVTVNGNAMATVRNSTFANNGIGLEVVVSASAILNAENDTIANGTFGIHAANGGTVRVSNSLIASNSNAGINNDGSALVVSLSGNQQVGNVFTGVFTSTVIKQ
jgi:hypothetical protein